MSFGIDLISRQAGVSAQPRLIVRDRGWTTAADHIKQPAQLCIKWFDIVSTRPPLRLAKMRSAKPAVAIAGGPREKVRAARHRYAQIQRLFLSAVRRELISQEMNYGRVKLLRVLRTDGEGREQPVNEYPAKRAKPLGP